MNGWKRDGLLDRWRGRKVDESMGEKVIEKNIKEKTMSGYT